MRVAQLDIGNSNLKGFVYDVTDVSTRLIHTHILQTPSMLADILVSADVCLNALRQYDPVGLMVTTYGNAVVAGTGASARLHRPLDACTPYVKGLLPYRDSGFPSFFPGIGARLREMHRDGHDTARPLPLSGFIAASLADEPEWSTWDFTQASNSGHWHQAHREWVWIEKLPHVPTGACTPGMHVGVFQGMAVLLGGHEIAFISATERCAYLTTGTYTIVSVPKAVFAPQVHEQDTVRWILDAAGVLHKQMCLPTQVLLDTVGFEKFAAFLETELDEDLPIYTVGVLAEEVDACVKAVGLSPQCQPSRQYEQVAQFIARLL